MHFSPVPVTRGTNANEPQGHQIQPDDQVDDPFVVPRGNIMADNQVFLFISYFKNIFLEFIIG